MNLFIDGGKWRESQISQSALKVFPFGEKRLPFMVNNAVFGRLRSVQGIDRKVRCFEGLYFIIDDPQKKSIN
jgi:hypothetical protein